MVHDAAEPAPKLLLRDNNINLVEIIGLPPILLTDNIIVLGRIIFLVRSGCKVTGLCNFAGMNHRRSSSSLNKCAVKMPPRVWGAINIAEPLSINALQYSTFMVEDVQGHVQGRALSVSSQNL